MPFVLPYFGDNGVKKTFFTPEVLGLTLRFDPMVCCQTTNREKNQMTMKYDFDEELQL